MRGDRPGHILQYVCGLEFTPHARGSTPDPDRPRGAGLVYPACAGIDLPWMSMI